MMLQPGEEKLSLRTRLRRRRARLSERDWSERCARIRARLHEVSGFDNARSVALFWPMLDRREVDLRPLDVDLRRRGLRLAYPCSAVPDGRQQGFCWTRSAEDLQLGSRGFSEPGPDCPPVEPGQLDLIVVPALSVSPAGHRLGYGAGFYDRALSEFRPPAIAVAVIFEAEIRSEVPVEPHDQAVDWIVSECRSCRSLIV